MEVWYEASIGGFAAAVTLVIAGIIIIVIGLFGKDK